MRSIFREGASLIRRYRWLPALASTASAIGLIAALLSHLKIPWILCASAGLAVTSYGWGYSVRALKHPLWPPLSHLKRRSYGEVWDAIAISERAAAVAVSGHAREDDLRGSGMAAVRNVLEFASVAASDEMLEIGCGIGRIGLELAPYCRTWTGADISANIVHYAEERLRGVDRIRLVLLSKVGLAEFSDASFDVVYMTNVVPHLDEIDRWRYAEEAFRVLRPGGRIFIDSVDLESDAGWTMFANDAKRFRDLERPPYMPRYSTAAELMAYAWRAGFERVESRHRSPLVIVIAVKPASAATRF